MAEVKDWMKDKTGGKAESPVKEASSAIGTAVEAVTGTAKDVGNAIADVAGQAKDRAQEFASAAGDVAVQATHKAGEWACAASDTAQDFGKELTALVRRYPAWALLAGVGLGFVIGKLTTSRS